MKLEIFEKSTRVRVGMIKVYSFVQYIDDFCGQGSFTIKIPTNEQSLSHIDENNYVLFEDGVAGIIKRKKTSQDNDTEIEISGYLTPFILSYRSFEVTAKYTGSVPKVLRKMVSDYFIDNQNQLRNIEYLKLSNNANFNPDSDTNVSVQYTGNSVLDAMSQLSLQYNFGFELFPVILDYDEESGIETNLSEFEFRVFEPKDRTINNTDGNTPVVFSFELNNLSRLDYEKDARAYANVAIVASEGEGTSRKILEVGETQASGIDRIEFYVDARDIQSDTQGEVLSEPELNNLMEQRGLAKLEEHQRFETFDCSIISGDMSYEYKKDFFKGDFVSVYDKNLNINVNLQITSVLKSSSNGVEYFDIVFGYERIKVDKIFDTKKVG